MPRARISKELLEFKCSIVIAGYVKDPMTNELRLNVLGNAFTLLKELVSLGYVSPIAKVNAAPRQKARRIRAYLPCVRSSVLIEHQPSTSSEDQQRGREAESTGPPGVFLGGRGICISQESALVKLVGQCPAWSAN